MCQSVQLFLIDIRARSLRFRKIEETLKIIEQGRDEDRFEMQALVSVSFLAEGRGKLFQIDGEVRT